jgi:hypothetical protein
MRLRWVLLVGVLAVTACQDRKNDPTSDPPRPGPGTEVADDPLRADDAPSVHGRVVFVGPWTDEDLTVGFAGKGADGKEHSNMTGMGVSPENGGSVTSETFAPQLTSLVARPKDGVTYRHTRMSPGEYLVYVKRNKVLAAWQKVTVKAGDRHAVDLTIDPARTGELVVTLPEAEAAQGFPRALSVRPADLDVPVSPTDFAFDAAEVRTGQATVTVKGVPAGRYRVTRGKSKGEAEVVAGKSAAVTLVRDEPARK